MKGATHPLLEALRRAARDVSLFEPGRPVLAAFSGGADSLALLHALRVVAPRGAALQAVHVHHGIRGAEADADAAFVRARCSAWGVPLAEGRVDTPALARRRHISLEMAAREARYGFFREILSRLGAAVVVTAHTADDQAETILLKLLRGAGSRGLAAMASRAMVLGVPVARPFLGVTRARIEEYLRAAGEAWREDRTNLDTSLLRNRVRHELLPLLEARYNPRIREILARTAGIFRDEEEWLQPLTEAAYARATADSESGALNAARMAVLPRALRRRVIRAWLMRHGLPEEMLDFDLAERVDRLIGSRNGTGAVETGAGLSVVSEYGVWRVESVRKEARMAGSEAPLRAPGETRLPDWGIRVRIVPARGYRKTPPPGLGRLPCRAWLDARVLEQGGLRIRGWQPGDRMAVSGGTKKLQDLFTDAKVPRIRRARIPLVVCGGDIAWIPGGPVSALWTVPSLRAPAVRIEIAALEPDS